MLTSMSFFAPPLPVAVPPLLSGPPPALPFAPGIPFGEPPSTPGCLPSGEMETRAARFPCGGCTTGAGGAGVAEREMNVVAFPFATLDWEEQLRAQVLLHPPAHGTRLAERRRRSIPTLDARERLATLPVRYPRVFGPALEGQEPARR